MEANPKYDVAIIGGGLAGLAVSILMARHGRSVILFEKEKYPFHKVCGEYISLESKPFLADLGIPISQMDLPVIDTFELTATNGKKFRTKLPLGGFGISRYMLDATLAKIAMDNGVILMQEARVDEVIEEKTFSVKYSHVHHSYSAVEATVCCGAFGKRSNLDVKWKRPFTGSRDRLNNFVAVKYHIESDWQKNVIGLHNFDGGYCGISKIEDDKNCLCYMTKAGNLKKSGNDVRLMERNILSANPYLKNIFDSSTVLQEFPVTISQISFSKKQQVEKGILMLGDAAGMITPLCGNGMSIALHSAKIASALVELFLNGKITRSQMENEYGLQWRCAFARRMTTGRSLQRFFGSNILSNMFVGAFNALPVLAKPVIRLTHGQPF